MTEPQQDIQSLLAALASQGSHLPSAPLPPLPPLPGQLAPAYPPLATQAHQVSYPGPHIPNYGSFELPQPAHSGNLDLSSVRPIKSGNLNFSDGHANPAVSIPIPSYDRPVAYSNGNSRTTGEFPRLSRSRSPRKRDAVYREDRWEDRTTQPGRDYPERAYSPSARDRANPGANGPGRGRSPIAAKGPVEDTSEMMQIEANLVGLIIGRQGENLRRIEADTACRVQFLPSVDGSMFRQCRINGPKGRRDEVKEAISRIVFENGMPLNGRVLEKGREVSTRPVAVAPKGVEDHIKIMVPDRTVGLIIGRGGETIRDLQERSGCHINIVDESKSTNGLRPVNLIGPPESAMKAKELIMEIVDSDSRISDPTSKIASAGRPVHQAVGPGPVMGMGSGMGSGMGMGMAGIEKFSDTVLVPSEAVGMIIGKGGETIKEMQSSTGCRINVAQASGSSEGPREIGLVGTRDSVMRAKQAIEEKVEAVRHKEMAGFGRGRANAPEFARDNHQQYYGHTNHIAQSQPGSGAANTEDPYAPYGGYENYCNMLYTMYAAQQQQQQQATLHSSNGGAPPSGTS